MWSGNEILVWGATMSVYQCGSCRDHYDPDHWSFEYRHYRSCGHATEEDAKEAAETHMIEMATTIMQDAMNARAARTVAARGTR